MTSIIPVRNEAAYLVLVLDALRNQYRVDGSPILVRVYEVLVLLNNCTDDSAAVAEVYQQLYPFFLNCVDSITS